MGRLILLLLVVALVGWVVYREIVIHQLRQLMNGLEHPELWLPRKERQAHARKLLRREDDEYSQRLIEKTTNFIYQQQQGEIQQ